MTGSGSSLFATVIEEHLALKRRNAQLEPDLPLDEFVADDPFHNHPLFKTEAEAREEEEETGEHPAVALEIPPDTLAMPAVGDDEQVEDGDEPRGWMETTASSEFTWD